MANYLDLFERMLAGRDHLIGGFLAADCAAFPFLKYARLRDPEDDELFIASSTSTSSSVTTTPAWRPGSTGSTIGPGRIDRRPLPHHPGSRLGRHEVRDNSRTTLSAGLCVAPG